VTAVVAGVAELAYGQTQLPSTMAYSEALVIAALADAGLTAGQVGAVLSVNPRSDSYLVHAEALAERLGIQPEVAVSLEAGGAAPLVMLQYAVQLVESGTVPVAVVLAADLPKGGMSARVYLETITQVGPIHPEFEASYGITPRSLFGLMATAYLDHFGATTDDLGAVAVHDRAMAAGHPNARFTAPITLDEYRSSPMVCDPLRRLDCAPVADGGGALVVTAAGVGDRSHPDVVLTGFGAATAHAHLSQASSLIDSQAGTAARRALHAAGLRLEDVDVALIYDCFSIAMVMNIESIGLSAPGAAGKDFASGRFAGAGGPYVNTHGGLLSHGYPARAAGMGNLVESVVQLRGQAHERQVPQCGVALVHGMSGAQSGHAVAVLQRAS
jgi:acetyl-CoA acetyltransferase